MSFWEAALVPDSAIAKPMPAADISAAMRRLWAEPPANPSGLIIADRSYWRAINAVSAEYDAREIWRAKRADWRRAKCEGRKAYRRSMQATRLLQ